MDRETIIKLAREAGIVFDDAAAPFYERFANLVAEHVIKDAPDYKMGYADGVTVEREQCAKVCEAQENRVVQRHPARLEFDPNSMMARKCAAVIRARGNHD